MEGDAEKEKAEDLSPALGIRWIQFLYTPAFALDEYLIDLFELFRLDRSNSQYAVPRGSMRKLSLFLFVFSMLMGWKASAAYASPYVSGNFGYTWLEDFDMEGNRRDGGEFSFDRGHTITAAVGNVFSNGLRAEIEIGYRTNEADEVKKSNGETSGVDSDIVTLSLMASCFYDFMPSDKVSPFVGAGIGFANVDGEVPNNNAQDDVLAYQLAAGLAFAVSDAMKIDIQYRLFGTDNPEFKELDGEYMTHNLMIGLRSSF